MYAYLHMHLLPACKKQDIPKLFSLISVYPVVSHFASSPLSKIQKFSFRIASKTAFLMHSAYAFAPFGRRCVSS